MGVLWALHSSPPNFVLKLRPVPCEGSAPEGPWGDQWGDVGEGTLGTRWLWVHTWTKSPFVRDAWERRAAARARCPPNAGSPAPPNLLPLVSLSALYGSAVFTQRCSPG